MEKAQSLINKSIGYDKTIKQFYTEDVATNLLIECEDNNDMGDSVEYWGTTDDGMKWRVLLVKRTEDAWWDWHDKDYERTSPTMEEAEARCKAWIEGASTDGPEL